MVRPFSDMAFKVLAIGMALVLGMALSPAARALALHPLGTSQVANDPGTILGVVNTNPSGGAIIGQVGPYQTATAPGTGVYGTFNAATGSGQGVLGVGVNGYGVIAEQYGGYFPAMYAQNYSPLGGPAMQAVANGVAVLGQSSKTDAIFGITTAPSSAFDTPPTSYAAVVGQDTAGAGTNNVGVVGTTLNGPAGVLGQNDSTSFSTQGVMGVGTDAATGVYGDSVNGSGLRGRSQTGYGVFGFSNAGIGVKAETFSNAAPALLVYSAALPGPEILATDRGGKDVMSLDTSGNMILSGTLTQNGTPAAVSRTPSGAKLVTYSARQSQPTTEDVGEGQLRNGAAYVRLDPSFASIIDHGMRYHVFITPEGNAQSLYVTNKTSAGFEVRESLYGHDSLAFDYRIVAKPYDSNLARLPLYREAVWRDGKLMSAGLTKVRKAPLFHFSAPRIPRQPKRFLRRRQQ